MIKIQEKSINQDGGWKNGARGNYAGDIIVADIKPKNRIESIDLLRGIVMIIMAIDHVRDYFHFDAFLYSPVDISQTSAGLFITRWITHLCAPTFIFLAGVSTYFVAQRKTLNDTSFFLLTRGIWLVLLQLTLIRFSWNFDPLFRYNSNTIISTIGFCMIVLSGLIYLRIRTIFFIGIVMVVGHNLLDGIYFKEGTLADVLWSFLHVQKSFDLGSGYAFTFLYPVMPWVGVMALGYCFGILFNPDYSSKLRKALLSQLGILCLLVFFTLRAANIYGDPVPWSRTNRNRLHNNVVFQLAKVSSFNALFISNPWDFITPACSDGGQKSQTLATCYTFWKRCLILLCSPYIYNSPVGSGCIGLNRIFMAGNDISGIRSERFPFLNGSYGFSLWVVYLVWLMVVVLLYPLCVYWNAFKIRNKKKWWVSYV